MIRGGSYSAAFLVVMVFMGLTSVGLALVALPAALLVGFAFGGIGMAISTFMRSWQDFDLMTTVQFTLFLFSGTFVPATAYPAVLRWVVEGTPLYRSVDLIRGITTASWSVIQVWDVLYLLVLFGIGVTVAAFSASDLRGRCEEWIRRADGRASHRTAPSIAGRWPTQMCRTARREHRR